MRRKNQVEKALAALPLLEKHIAVNYGRKALSAGMRKISAIEELRQALKMARCYGNPDGLLRTRFKNDGWQCLFQLPRNRDQFFRHFHQEASKSILVLLNILTNAVDKYDGAELRQLADVIEANNPERPVDPAGREWMMHPDNSITVRRVKELLEKWSHVVPDKKTIRNRARALGVKPASDRKGAPYGKRRQAHRAKR